MIDLSQAVISRLAIHRVGNKAMDENSIISQKLADVTPELEPVLVNFFTKRFTGDTYYKFTHPSGLDYNDMYNFVKSILWSESETYARSVDILKHIYHHGVHPNIKGGEVYVAYLKNCILDDEPLDAVGIFKSEHKDTFISFSEQSDGIEASGLLGIALTKLDKGCIVFNTEENTGYRVIAFDGSKKQGVYWLDDVLQVLEDTDDNTYTRNSIGLCAAFAKEVVGNVHGKKDEILLLKDTFSFFERAENFELDEYAQEVLKEQEYIDSFKNFAGQYEERTGRKLENDHEISRIALKAIKPKFKSLIKLDTGIEIALKFNNIESGKRFVERGYDKEAKMSYYKVFFNEELDN